MKRLIKSLINVSNTLPIYHRHRNKHSLTLIMLHRVLPREDFGSEGANPEWTLSTEVFAQFLEFISAHFNAIDYAKLVECDGDIRKLPSQSVMITFDDGWRDNFTYAMPLLEKYNVPAHLFIATDYVGLQNGFWQEQLYSAFSSCPESLVGVSEFLGLSSQQQTHADIVKYLENKNDTVNDVLSRIKPYLPAQRQMLCLEELQAMRSSVFTVGSHGASHRPLGTMGLQELRMELARSVQSMNDNFDSWIPNISFPHGSYSDATLDECRSLGVNQLFCSGHKSHGSIVYPLQRIHLSEQAISEQGVFSESKAAFNLFTREIV